MSPPLSLQCRAPVPPSLKSLASLKSWLSTVPPDLPRPHLMRSYSQKPSVELWERSSASHYKDGAVEAGTATMMTEKKPSSKGHRLQE